MLQEKIFRACRKVFCFCKVYNGDKQTSFCTLINPSLPLPSFPVLTTLLAKIRKRYYHFSPDVEKGIISLIGLKSKNSH